MKNIRAFLVAVACLLPAMAMAATVTLNPVADAYVQGGNKAAVNYGTTIDLRAQTSGTASSNYDSYLRFDTGTGQVTSAKLRLYAALSKSGSVATSAHAVADTTWSETAITWNTKPGLGASLGSVTVAGTAYAWQEIDVTAYVQSERAAGRNVISLGLHNGATSSVYLSASSREGANPPQLVLITNDAPTVSLTAPTTGSTYTAPASIALTASAADADGSIASIEFYNGATLIGPGTLTGGSYTLDWTSVGAGSYSLTAKATDNQGAVTTSTPVTVTVNAPLASGVYYIHADHLNTPRVITDASNKVVWRWDSDPFGAEKANEDPDGDGAKFTYNLRFPGQYYDRETNLHYNYFRDYDPTTGRYVESDPIGLAGGINTYAYVGGNPLLFIDPLGLARYNDPLNQIANGAAGLPRNANISPDLRDKGLFGPVCGSGPTASWIPDGVWKNACKRHDECYSRCGADRLQCDLDLLMDSHGNVTYFLAVRRFGETPFLEAQKECACTR